MYVLRWIKTLTLMKDRDRSGVFWGCGGLGIGQQLLSSDNAYEAKMKSSKAEIVIMIITQRRG